MTDRATALRPAIQAAFEADGLDGICELFAQMEGRLEARIAGLEKHIAGLENACAKTAPTAASRPPSTV